MKNKRVKLVVLICFLLALLLGLIGVTFSYFQNSGTLTNEFYAGDYKTTASEQFVSPTNWKPGDTTPKTLVVKNEGTIDMYARVSITESWKSKNDEDLPLEQDGNRVSIINFDNQSDWTKKGNYYYYNDVLEPNDETSSLIQSVTFNPLVTGDYTCSTVGNKTTCTSTGEAYEGGTYTLTFNIETVQSEAKEPVWNIHDFVYKTRQVEGEITTGDEVCLGTECFYVISSDSNKTVMLAKYNLLVGDVYYYDSEGNKEYTYVKTLSNSDEGYGFQNSSAKGFVNGDEVDYIGVVPFSSTNYWDNSVCEHTGPVYTPCTGTEGLLPEYSQNGESYSGNNRPYVYNNSLNTTAPNVVDYNSVYGTGSALNNGYTIAYFVENYVELLKNLGADDSITGRLLSLAEAISLGCTTSSASGAPTWVRQASFWIGNAAYATSVYGINSNTVIRPISMYTSSDNGVRPVIEIPTSELN